MLLQDNLLYKITVNLLGCHISVQKISHTPDSDTITLRVDGRRGLQELTIPYEEGDLVEDILELITLQYYAEPDEATD